MFAHVCECVFLCFIFLSEIWKSSENIISISFNLCAYNFLYKFLNVTCSTIPYVCKSAQSIFLYKVDKNITGPLLQTQHRWNTVEIKIECFTRGINNWKRNVHANFTRDFVIWIFSKSLGHRCRTKSSNKIVDNLFCVVICKVLFI